MSDPPPQTSYTTPPPPPPPPLASSQPSPPMASYPLLTSPPHPHDPCNLTSLSLSLPATSFIFSASLLLFHPPTSRIVLVHDTPSNRYFLPRGRKDIGESLPACALREGFEESGFRGELICWGSGSRGTLQPVPPGPSWGKTLENKEAFWVQAQPLHTRRRAIIYFTYYFLAILPEDDPVPDKGKERLVGGHESGYEGVLVPVEEAVKLLSRERGRGEDSLVFVTDEHEVRDLVKEGMVWKAGSGRGVEGDPAWGSNSLEGEGGGMWKSGPVDGNGTFGIEKATADKLAAEGKGRFIPCPENGSDDSVVQARVVYEGWQRLKDVYGWK